jgi:hypothetical protein
VKLVRAASFLAGLALLAMPATVHAQLDVASQTITLDVQAVDEIIISGNFTIQTTSIGAQTPYTLATYEVNTNSTAARTITAEVGAALPTGVTLNISLADPDGAGSNAVTTPRDLSQTPQNVVTNLKNTTSGSKGITYTVTTTAATPVASTGITVTLTLIV